MVYLESQDNCITKSLDSAWMELEDRMDSSKDSQWGGFAVELFTDALSWQHTLGDGEELLRLLRDYIKRIYDYEEFCIRSSMTGMEAFKKSLSPSQSWRLAQINQANRLATYEAKARGEDNFLIRVYSKRGANPWIDRCNSRAVCRTHRLSAPRAHRSASRPTFTQSGGGSGGDDGDSDQPPEPPQLRHPLALPLNHLAFNPSHPWHCPGSRRVAGGRRAA
jgi:hypothetical protein